jgi:hypothetical protein
MDYTTIMNKFYESRDAYRNILVNSFNYLNSLPTTWYEPLLANLIIVTLEAISKAASEYMLCHNNYMKELRKVGDELSAEDTRLHNIILDKISYCEDLHDKFVEKYVEK